MGFIRFTNRNYILETQTACLTEPAEPVEYCPSYDDVYDMPAKQGDTVKFIIDKTEIDHKGADVVDLRIGLTNCGVLIEANIGIIDEADGQYFITAIIPANIADCTYNFVIYNIINPIDCGQFAGSTLGGLSAYNLGQFQNCILGNF